MRFHLVLKRCQSHNLFFFFDNTFIRKLVFLIMVLAAGKMYRPTDVAFGGNGIVFVVEQFNHRVSKWTYSQPNYIFTLDTGWGSNDDGTSGEGAPIGDGGVNDNALYRPTGIAFDSTNSRLYVTDTFHNRVRVINSTDGEFVESFGVGGSAAAEFYRPAGIAINTSTGTFLVIADELNSRVVKYDVNSGSPNNPVVLTDPSVTTGLSFVRPHGVIFQENNDKFNIGDSLRGKISVYFTNGTFDEQYGTPGSAPTNTNVFYPGSGEGLLGASEAIFADTRNNALKTTNAAAIALTTGATAGTGNGELYYPESASAFTDTVNYVLAANTLNNRVETYSSAASVLTSEDPFNFGSP